MYHINSPKMDGSWALFKDITFDPFKPPRACRDTIHGICYEDISLSDCINKCKKSPECDAGYYLQNNNKSYCLDLMTGIAPDTNPVLYMRKKDDFKDTNNLSTYTFINTDVFPYPPNDANILKYDDIILLHNVETNSNLATNDTKGIILFDKNKSTDIRIISRYPRHIINSVKYQELIGLIIPETNLLLRESVYINGLMAWMAVASWKVFEEDALILIHANENKDNQSIQYGDKFHILYNRVAFLGLNPSNKLKIYFQSKDDMISQRIPFTFQFIPKNNGYYCDNGLCNSITMDKTTINGKGREYNGKTIYRSDICYGVCEGIPRGVKAIMTKHPVILITIAIILIIIGISVNIIHLAIIGIIIFGIYFILRS